MNNKIYLLFAVFFVFSVNSVFSQGCDTDEPSDSGEAPKIKIFGYIQPEFDYNFNDADENTFRFRRARIGVTGKVLDDFRYYFMLEASPFIGGEDAYLMDAFVAWEKYNWSRIAMGSFKQPFGREVNTACHSLITIDRAIVSDQLVAPQRDYGIMVLGGNKYNRLNYAVALMNGNALKIKDNNKKKDIMGRVSYKLLDFLTVGGSFRYGYPTNDDDDRTTLGGEVLFELSNFHVQGEYIHDEGEYNRASGGGCGSEPMELGNERDGAYIMAWYTGWDIQPVFKYEFFDQDLDNKDIPNAYTEMMTIGANYFFNDKIRLQLNYQSHIETVINKDNDMFLAQIQVRF
ncbi:MAG: porin [Bacteroidota bacterium]